MIQLQQRSLEPKVTSMIKSFFASTKALAGKPSYKVLNSSGTVVVTIPYFMPSSVPVLAESKINALGIAITRLFNVPGRAQPTVELRLVRLRYPYLDSSILAQYVAVNAGKYNFLRMQKMMFNKVPATARGASICGANTAAGLHPATQTCQPLAVEVLPSQMTGVKVELAGRLTTQRSIPRKTVENGHVGSFTVNNTLKSSLDFSQYASKNKLNAFTIKV